MISVTEWLSASFWFPNAESKVSDAVPRLTKYGSGIIAVSIRSVCRLVKDDNGAALPCLIDVAVRHSMVSHRSEVTGYVLISYRRSEMENVSKKITLQLKDSDSLFAARNVLLVR